MKCFFTLRISNEELMNCDIRNVSRLQLKLVDRNYRNANNAFLCVFSVMMVSLAFRMKMVFHFVLLCTLVSMFESIILKNMKNFKFIEMERRNHGKE